MTPEESKGGSGEVSELRAAVIEALVIANLPEDARPPGADQLLGVPLAPPALPSALERGLRQIEVSAHDLWIRTLTAQVGLESIRGELERTNTTLAALEGKRSHAAETELAAMRRDIDRLEKAVTRLDEKRWSEGKIFAALAVLVGLAVGLSKLVGIG